MILGIQILGILFAIFMLYITFLHKKKKELTSKEYLFWAVAWIVFLLLTLFPTSLDFLIIGVLDLSRRLDFFIIIGFMFLIGMIFHIYLTTKKTQNKVEKIVRQLAIENAKTK